MLERRQVFHEGGAGTTILLGMEDVTERRILEREKDELLREKDGLLREKDTLLEELQHRIANSLQIIASIILMKARVVQSEETRFHLEDAHKRVLSIAAVQKQLHASGAAGAIEIAPYLSKLCESLAISMIGGRINSMLRSKLWPALRARPYRLLTPLSRRRSSKPLRWR